MLKTGWTVAALCLGVALLTSVSVFADAFVLGTINTSASASTGTAGSSSDSDSAAVGPGSATSSSAGVGNGDANSSDSSNALFNMTTDGFGVVTITGSLGNSAFAQSFNNVDAFASGDANLAATLQLTSAYDYVLTATGNISNGSNTGGNAFSGAGTVSLNFFGVSDSASAGTNGSDSFLISDSGLLSAGFYSLVADANGSAFMNAFHNETSITDSSVVYSLELTPSEIPEPATMTLLGVGLLAVAARGWRRRRTTSQS